MLMTKEKSDMQAPENLVKSKQRVADHGEVFTPAWLVEDMLDLVKDESERIDSRFLEPACGSGNFLVPVLERKLKTVKSRYGKSEFEYHHNALFALMCVYGIELLADNVTECRENLLQHFAKSLGQERDSVVVKAAGTVLAANIVHGDALTMQTTTGEAITFPEWAYIGKGKFQRRDFRFDTLTQMSSFGEDTLFGDIGNHEIFQPAQEYPLMKMQEIANV